MNKSNFSQTQLANIMVVAGVLVMLASKFGYVVSQDSVAFLIGAAWTLGSTVYSYWQRWKKGDLTLGGWRLHDPKMSEDCTMCKKKTNC